jgi:hypothetical protein
MSAWSSRVGAVSLLPYVGDSPIKDAMFIVHEGKYEKGLILRESNHGIW